MTNHVDEWLDGAERRVCSQPTPTGWDTGLCQDYCRKLSMWFASRLDARHTLRRWFGEQRKGTKGNEMTTHQDTSTERDEAAQQPQGQQCRSDGRCQYAIDHGAEGLGACPPGKCVQPQGQAVSDEQIASIVRAVEDKDKVPSFSNGFYTLTPEELSAFTSSILALRDKPATAPDGTPNNAV